MLQIYHDFYGCQAVIRTAKSGAARLTIRNRDSRLIHAKNYKNERGAKNYKNERGAKIAMGRLSDGWHPVGATKGVARCLA